MSAGPGESHAARGADFIAAMTGAGMERPVAEELERRIRIVEEDEAGDEARQPLSGRELGGYVLVTVAICGLSALAVIL
ncbi:hypothetical protein [Sediminivirga luteola]|uniref:Uncharacterized protein n=1 Tax=Sediminivirga luteola TaxID=1774748 RepID=A0A8J2TZ95_9MICO|nr:hypothetical protein [Sediminivirga luteola]GGA19662.1 hypothetical protein GCM10011333_23470 [Sediminivirga luteola]